MAAVLLPPTFHNSFWSNQDHFRTGLEVLMRKLREGCEESVEIGVFIKVRGAPDWDAESTEATWSV
jgi:hypothetical protein